MPIFYVEQKAVLYIKNLWLEGEYLKMQITSYTFDIKNRSLQRPIFYIKGNFENKVILIKKCLFKNIFNLW